MEDDPQFFLGARRLDSDYVGERFIEGFWQDPVKFIDKLLVFVAIVISFTLCCVFRKRILFLATGDDMIRLSVFDIIREMTRVMLFFGLTGTGYCVYYGWNGRYFFGALVFASFGCTFASISNKRISKLCCNFGQTTGLVPYVVRIENICVCNIPVAKSSMINKIPLINAAWQSLVEPVVGGATADIYLEIEMGINPTMSTRVVEQSDGECVYFADAFNLNAHDSCLETDMQIRVMDQDVVGHDELAYCTIDANQLIQLARAGRESAQRGGVRIPLRVAGNSGSRTRKDKSKANQSRSSRWASAENLDMDQPWIGMTIIIDDASESTKTTLAVKDHMSTYARIPKS